MHGMSWHHMHTHPNPASSGNDRLKSVAATRGATVFAIHAVLLSPCTSRLTRPLAHMSIMQEGAIIQLSGGQATCGVELGLLLIEVYWVIGCCALGHQSVCCSVTEFWEAGHDPSDRMKAHVTWSLAAVACTCHLVTTTCRACSHATQQHAAHITLKHPLLTDAAPRRHTSRTM